MANQRRPDTIRLGFYKGGYLACFICLLALLNSCSSTNYVKALAREGSYEKSQMFKIEPKLARLSNRVKNRFHRLGRSMEISHGVIETYFYDDRAIVLILVAETGKYQVVNLNSKSGKIYVEESRDNVHTWQCLWNYAFNGSKDSVVDSGVTFLQGFDAWVTAFECTDNKCFKSEYLNPTNAPCEIHYEIYPRTEVFKLTDIDYTIFKNVPN